ncbi:hypothetical protein [Aliarcobacter butzleri]|uniref:hypothetical protein n=1 Tax=Aliarcobacter butzleri TaxID=28197 RepID=UPI0021B38392|nr:hypothetical protein [Aliarcobacter butzleri]MCT7586617.1 hypothetical protein [Aliarcobacter butzleri]MCT7587737.1 hypothetical protein [Aliarcobacter butzleri]
MENLQKRKKKIIEQIGEEGLEKLKFSKLLKLTENEIQELMNYWTIKQVHQMLNEVFNLNISAPLFYKFCANLKKDEISKTIKRDKKLDKGVVQEITTNKKESENAERGQLKIAQTKELKDDGQFKVADKSEFI